MSPLFGFALKQKCLGNQQSEPKKIIQKKCGYQETALDTTTFNAL